MFIERIIEQYGDAYNRFGAPARARHEAMLETLTRQGQVSVETRALEGQHWEISVAAGDHRGILSLIAGLLTGYQISIRRGDVFTVAGPDPAAESPGRILDVFEVISNRPLHEMDWEPFRRDLTGMIERSAAGEYEQVRRELIERVSDTLTQTKEKYEPLYPVTITFDNESSPTYTLLEVVSRETPGFLFSLSNALTMLNIDIHQARIRTVGDEVHDTFWIRQLRKGRIETPEALARVRMAATLIKQFTYLIPHSSNPAQALLHFRGLLDLVLKDPDRMDKIEELQSAEMMQALADLMGVSSFLWEDFLRMQYDTMFPIISAEARALDQAQNPSQTLTQLLAEQEDFEQRVKILNRFKDREIFRADLRHITGRTGDVEFSHEVSDLAALIVNHAAQMCYASLEERFGTPILEDNRLCRWAVVALGKCGGREMGFASDIELMFVYEGMGRTDGDREKTNQVFFEQMVQMFLKTVKARQKGVFEIDLRLRPFGGKGTLAVSLNAFQKYYRAGGAARQFERIALTKMRPIAGDLELAAEVIEARNAFVYSGAPLDYSDMLHLRRRQATELATGSALNAKYSPGGLVDLEYFVQARQIEVGSEKNQVRIPNTMQALEQLERSGAVKTDLAERIRHAYQFLRRVIDVLRAIRGNARDLSIPPSNSRAIRYLTGRMGYDDTAGLEQEIQSVMTFGRELWRKIESPE